MNVLYLKYALEVAKTGSINKAAENLYMAQPNLSRSIKDLEASLGISIFDRTSKGMILTQEGEILLKHAEELLRHVDKIENMFRDEQLSKLTFSLAAPRSCYISEAFALFAQKMKSNKKIELIYRETNAAEICNRVLHAESKLGILRYAAKYEDQFQAFLLEKGLRSELVAEFSKQILISEQHALSTRETVTAEDLKSSVEIFYADPFVPMLPSAEIIREELGDDVEQKILVYDRASCFDMLSSNPNTFFWSERLSCDTLKRYGLVQKEVKDLQKDYQDVMIFGKDYSLTKADKDFITELCNVKRKNLSSGS